MADDLIQQFSLRLAQGEGEIPVVYREMIARGVAPIKPKYISVLFQLQQQTTKMFFLCICLFCLFVDVLIYCFPLSCFICAQLCLDFHAW